MGQSYLYIIIDSSHYCSLFLEYYL